VWTGGLQGLGCGLLLGVASHWALEPLAGVAGIDPGLRKPAFGGEGLRGVLEEALRAARPSSVNHRILFALCGGAALSYLGATTAGKNSRVWMQHVYQRGAHEKVTPYEFRRRGGGGGRWWTRGRRS
jgi:hypothetical protein